MCVYWVTHVETWWKFRRTTNAVENDLTGECFHWQLFRFLPNFHKHFYLGCSGSKQFPALRFWWVVITTLYHYKKPLCDPDNGFSTWMWGCISIAIHLFLPLIFMQRVYHRHYPALIPGSLWGKENRAWNWGWAWYVHVWITV